MLARWLDGTSLSFFLHDLFRGGPYHINSTLSSLPRTQRPFSSVGKTAYVPIEIGSQTEGDAFYGLSSQRESLSVIVPRSMYVEHTKVAWSQFHPVSGTTDRLSFLFFSPHTNAVAQFSFSYSQYRPLYVSTYQGGPILVLNYFLRIGRFEEENRKGERNPCLCQKSRISPFFGNEFSSTFFVFFILGTFFLFCVDFPFFIFHLVFSSFSARSRLPNWQ